MTEKKYKCKTGYTESGSVSNIADPYIICTMYIKGFGLGISTLVSNSLQIE